MVRLSRRLGWLALAVVACALIGWWLEIPVLTHLGAEHATMKPTTAAAAGALAIGVVMSSTKRGGVRHAWPGYGWLGVLIGLLGVVQTDTTVWPLDRILALRWGGSGANDPGRMAATTAVQLGLLGGALALLDVQVGGRRVSRWLAVAAAAPAFVVLTGHLYGAHTLDAVAGFSTQSLPASLVCSALAVAVLCARPEHGFMAVLSSDTVAGSSARRMIPPLLVVPVALGALRLEGQALGWYGTEFGVALLATGSALALVGLALRNARSMTRLEAGRDALLERIEGQRAALAAEQQFRSLVYDAPAGMFVTDAEGACTFVNNRWQGLTGLSMDEAVGDGWLAAIHPDDRARVGQEWALAATQQRTFALGYRYRQRTGETVWVECTTVAMLDVESRHTGYLGVVLDVSDRHEAIEALRRSEANFRAVVERAPLGFLVLRGRHVAYLNPVAVKLFGYDDASEMLGRDYTELMHPDELPRSSTRFAAAQGGAVLESRVARMRKRDGTDIFVENSPTPVVFDGAEALGAVIHDVTARVHADEERRRAAEALRQSEMNFRALVEASPLGILVRRDDAIVYANTSLQGILGRPLSSLVGARVHDVIVRVDELGPGGGPVVAPGQPVDGDLPPRVVCLGPGEAVLVFDCTTVAVTFDGVPARATVLVDVTERRRLEQARLAAEAELRSSLVEKETLLKEVHHRVKNNLQVIGSLISLQAETVVEPQTRAAFDEMRGRVRAIASVHERIYRGTRLDRVEVRSYLVDLVRDIGRALSEPGRAIVVDTSAAPVALDLDRVVPLALLVNEAVTNAFRHAFPRGRRDAGRVCVTLREVAAGFELEVADDGVGMSLELQGTATLAGGNSLGLSLIAGLARQLDGEVRFHHDNGTRCIVTFPRSESQERMSP